MKLLVTCTTDIKKAAHSRPHQLIEHLSNEHELWVLCINAWYLKNQDSAEFEHHFTYNQNVRVAYLSERRIGPGTQEVVAALELLARGEKFARSFDVHLDFDSIGVGYVAARLLKRAGIPTVFDLDDDVPGMVRTSSNVPTVFRNFGAFMARKTLGDLIRRADSITYTTPSLMELYSIPFKKSTRIPNGVNTNRFTCESPQERKREIGINSNEFVIGYAGVLREWVNLQNVFAAVRELDVPIKMLVVGGEGRFKEARETARRYGISDNVTFTGTVPYNDMPKYISAMDICLIPFEAGPVADNALPLKLLEYMSCGKPVISTPLSGVKSTVGSLVLYASTKQELKRAIVDLYSDDILRSEMGRTGQAFVRQNYSWDLLCRQFEAVLTKAALKGA